MVRNPSLLAALAVSRAFSGVDSALLDRIAAQTVQHRYARGEQIFAAGERALWLGVVMNGLVRLEREGKECGTAVALFGPRETVGSVAVCDDGSYPVTAFAAAEGTHVACVDAAFVHELAARDLAVAQGMIRALTDHSRALHARLGVASAGPVERRLVTLFLHLLERFGDQLEDGSWSIPVALSRAELAAFTDTTTESAIRTMSRWQKRGLVTTSRQGFVLPDLARLRALLTEAGDGRTVAA
ncbi:MAG: Crp/Fnr family transcriptional regulator [Polyangiaceae bacterium]|nr:Crp/Fnr family transcriptional regulator [Polyangiaceae bacterium]